MRYKKTVEEEINDFLNVWDSDQLCAFLKDVIPLCNLFDVDEDEDWVRDIVGEDDKRNVRLVRTVYLISRIAESHSATLCKVKINFKNLHLRMEKEVK